MNHANKVDMAADDARQYLVFELGEEHYAIDILKVQEIRDYENVTRLANAPAFIKGVSNLRGVIVPIVDLRIRFDLENATYDEQTVVVVVNVAERVIGVVVDRVSDVQTLAPDQVKPPPEFGISLPLHYIEGLGNVDGRMLILVDIEKLITSREMALMDQATADGEAAELEAVDG